MPARAQTAPGRSPTPRAPTRQAICRSGAVAAALCDRRSRLGNQYLRRACDVRPVRTRTGSRTVLSMRFSVAGTPFATPLQDRDSLAGTAIARSYGRSRALLERSANSELCAHPLDLDLGAEPTCGRGSTSAEPASHYPRGLRGDSSGALGDPRVPGTNTRGTRLDSASAYDSLLHIRPVRARSIGWFLSRDGPRAMSISWCSARIQKGFPLGSSVSSGGAPRTRLRISEDIIRKGSSDPPGGVRLLGFPQRSGCTCR